MTTAIQQFNNQATMSSREIAVLTGKEHRNVMRDCDALNENYEKLAMLKIEQGYYTHPNTGAIQYREFLLTKMQTLDLMTGYSIELRIKVNRRWEQLETERANSQFKIPSTLSEALRLAAAQAEEIEQKDKQIEQQTKQLKLAEPKVEMFNKVVKSDGLFSMSQVAKLLKLPFGRNKLFEAMRNKGLLYKHSNEPKQEYVERGIFQLKSIIIEHNNMVKTVTYVTPKGLAFLSTIFKDAA